MLQLSENLIWFLSGVFATVIGFVLTMIWDFRKSYKSKKLKEEQLVLIVRYELNNNFIVVNRNETLILHELEVLDKQKIVIEPLMSLRTTFWNLLCTNLPWPKKLHGSSLAPIAYRTIDYNDTLRSRENYRIQNISKSDYISHLKAYDKELIELGERLRKLLRETQAFLRGKTLEELDKEDEEVYGSLFKENMPKKHTFYRKK